MRINRYLSTTNLPGVLWLVKTVMAAAATGPRFSASDHPSGPRQPWTVPFQMPGLFWSQPRSSTHATLASVTSTPGQTSPGNFPTLSSVTIVGFMNGTRKTKEKSPKEKAVFKLPFTVKLYRSPEPKSGRKVIVWAWSVNYQKSLRSHSKAVLLRALARAWIAMTQTGLLVAPPGKSTLSTPAKRTFFQQGISRSSTPLKKQSVNNSNYRTKTTAIRTISETPICRTTNNVPYQIQTTLRTWPSNRSKQSRNTTKQERGCECKVFRKLKFEVFSGERSQ